MGADMKLTFDTEFDASGFEEGLSRMQEKSAKLTNDMRTIKGVINDSFGNGASSKVRELTRKFDEQSKEVKNLDNNAKRLKETYKKITSGEIKTASLENAEKKMKSLTKEIESGTRANDKLSSKYEELGRKIEAARASGQDFSKMAAKKDLLGERLKSSTDMLTEASKRAEKLQRTINKLKMNPETSREASVLAREIERAEKAANKMRGKAIKTGQKAVDQSTVDRATQRPRSSVRRRLTSDAGRLPGGLGRGIPFNINSSKFRDMQNNIKKVSNEANVMNNRLSQTKNIMKAQSDAVKKFVNGAIIGLASVAAAMKSIELAKESTDVAMSVESAMGNIEHNLGANSTAFKEWVDNSAGSFGIATSEAYKYGFTYSNLLSSITDSQKETSEETIKLMEATAVIASKTGRSYDDVAERIRSGMLGSTEAIEDLGVYTNISTLEASDAFRRLANDTAFSELEFNVQQQIRLNAILEQSFARYGDEVAVNTQSKHADLIMSLNNVKLALGNAFMPIYEMILPGLTRMAEALGALMDIIAQFSIALTSLFGGKGMDKKIVDNNKTLRNQADTINEVAEETDDAAEEVVDFGDDTVDTTKKIKKASKNLQGFDMLNKMSEEESDSSSDRRAKKPKLPKKKKDKSKKKNAPRIQGMDPSASFEALSNVEINPKILAWAKKAKKMIEDIKKALDPTIKALRELWDRGLKPLLKFTGKALITFYDRFLRPVAKWVVGEGFPKFVEIITDMIEKIDFDKLNEELAELWDALSPFTIMIGEGLLWFLENVLSPLAVWAINNIVPFAISALKSAIEILSNIIEANKPMLSWIWETFLKPMAEWAGFLVAMMLDAVKRSLEAISEWASQNHETIRLITALILGFLARIIFLYITKKVVLVIESIAGALLKFGLALTRINGKVMLGAIAVGLLAAAFIYIGSNWSKLNGLEKAIVIFSGLATAALAAALAVAVFHASWSVGIAAAAIGLAVGGLLATFGIVKNKVDPGGESLDDGGISTMDFEGLKSDGDSPDEEPQEAVDFFELLKTDFEMPKLAKGGLIPPGKPRPVIVGDNMVEDEIVSPVSTMEAAMAKVLDERSSNRDDIGSNSKIDTLIALQAQVLEAIQKGQVIQMDGRELGRTVQDIAANERRRTGLSYV